MNKHVSKTLRRYSFSSYGPMVWRKYYRRLKRAYNTIPHNKRNEYLAQLKEAT